MSLRGNKIIFGMNDKRSPSDIGVTAISSYGFKTIKFNPLCNSENHKTTQSTDMPYVYTGAR